MKDDDDASTIREKESSRAPPFSFEERLLVDHCGSSSSVVSTTKTVRLEALAQWNGGANNDVIHPFSDVDVIGDKIATIRMSISSHAMDGLSPLLPMESSVPQGFFLSVQPLEGLSLEEEASAVQSVFEELIRKRLLNTPVTDGKWDVVVVLEEQQQQRRRRLYQLNLPFENAAWTSDALHQSFRGTLPKICRGLEETRFFGWSGLEWSNFLVGYRDGGETGNAPSKQDPTFHKTMWWTWTSSETNNNNNNNHRRGLSFGIQYQTMVVDNNNNNNNDDSSLDWLPSNFLKETACPIGTKSMFRVVSDQDDNNDTYRLVPLLQQQQKEEEEEATTTTRLVDASSDDPSYYSLSIHQVLRRHRTNRGRFESTIDLLPRTNTNTAAVAESCKMTYRQVLPDFLTPEWRTLKVHAADDDDDDSMLQVETRVEWNPDDRSSVLLIEAAQSIEQRLLPSKIVASLEYAPTFLTIDDFPGDPNRGRVLPPARATLMCGGGSSSETTTTTVVYSNGLLLLPPVPDLSMPFNVIALTSSVYAYIIGIMVTILVRKGSEKIKYALYPDKKPESKLTRMKKKLREKFGGAKAKLLGGSPCKQDEKFVDEGSTPKREADVANKPKDD